MGSIRRASEDSRLRPFLSAHFDASAYLKGVVDSGKSEETLGEIVAFIDSVNEEIKGYISQHKDELMTGMQDVAVLAQRYQTLSSSSDKLKRSIQRMKKDALDAHEGIGRRTEELRKLHCGNTLLKQVRAFIHAKSQLDHHLKASSHDGRTVSETFLSDIRYAATAARTISDIETLLDSDTKGLSGVSVVAKEVKAIRNYAGLLRSTAQERLLQALGERNQASLAAALQVFFNLNSLPEILDFTVKRVAKECAKLSKTALNLEALVQEHPDLADTSNSGTSAMRDLRSSVARLSVLGRKSATSSNEGPPPLDKGNLMQQRVSMREMAHVWAMQMHDHALQINVLQRVVAKKEDPTTNRKFSSVLRGYSDGSAYLRSCSLLDLLWEYLAEDLTTLANEMLKNTPNAASRVYPLVRRMATDVMRSLDLIAEREMGVGSTGSTTGAMGGVTHSVFGCRTWDDSSSRQCLEGPALWGLHVLGGLGAFNTMKQTTIGVGSSSGSGVTSSDPASSSLFADEAGQARHGGGTGGRLMLGLKPLRDKYLLNALGRMTAPVLQMFPEMDGYTAAVPSKRDLMEFVKVVDFELSSCLIEGDVSFLADVTKEVCKVVRLLVTKTEGMVHTGAESMRMSHENGFARTTQQEHNHQLVRLLSYLRGVSLSMPQRIMRMVQDAPGSLLSVESTMVSSSSSSSAGMSPSSVRETVSAELRRVGEIVAETVDEVLSRQLVPHVLLALTSYTQSQLVSLLTEGIAVTTISGDKGSASHSSNDSVECSRTVQLLSANLPKMINMHLGSLPTPELVSFATVEFCERVMCTYVSVAALVRPVTEQSRLRIAKDMAALEVVLASAHPLDKQNSPIVREFKAFRQLLFSEESPSSHSPIKPKASANTTDVRTIPSCQMLLAEPFAADLRPSTLLGHLAACAPNQMPSPYASGNTSTLAYVKLITAPDDSGSVETLYANKAGGRKWQHITAERKAGEIVRDCLDVFMQRTAVADSSLKANLRGWYEVIVEVAGRYHE